MINKDGKLFGKISIIDIAVIVIIIALIVGAVIRFSGGSSKIVTSGEDIECTFIVRNLRQYTVDALKKQGPMFDKVSKEFIGDITDVRVEDGMYKVNMADGTFESSTPEERYNVYVTVKFKGKSGSNGYYTAANKFLGAGSSVNITTKYAECESTVYDIKEVK